MPVTESTGISVGQTADDNAVGQTRGDDPANEIWLVRQQQQVNLLECEVEGYRGNSTNFKNHILNNQHAAANTYIYISGSA